MNEEIIKIHGNINEWLKFAEAKNFGIIALNSAILGNILNHIMSKNFNQIYLVWLLVIGTLTVASLIISLFSFIPLTHHKIKSKNSKINNEKDLNYFHAADICQFSNEDFIQCIQDELKQDSFTNIDTMLVNEIYANARKTSRKYKLFTISLYFLLSSITVALLFLTYVTLTVR